MNKYRVIVYNDSPNANPHKVEFPYEAETKEQARAKGESFAAHNFPTDKTAISVEFSKKL